MYRVAMISKGLVAASTEPLILSLLAGGESYGYALTQEVKRLSGDKIEWTDGMLYPVLHRMEHRGLIKSRWGASGNITRSKRAAKRRWPPTTNNGHWFIPSWPD